MSTGVDGFKYLMSFPLIFASISTFQPSVENEINTRSEPFAEVEPETISSLHTEEVQKPERAHTSNDISSSDINNQSATSLS